MSRTFTMKRIEPYLGVAGLLLLWWMATDVLRVIDAGSLASPISVIGAIWDLSIGSFAGNNLLGHAGASVGRWITGVLMGCVIAIPLGVLMAWNKKVNAAVNPIFEVFRYIPPFAWVPLAILWFGTSLASQAVVVAIATIPPVLLNAHRSVLQIDDSIVHASWVLGASRRQSLLSVVAPTAAPGILTGVRIGFSNGWMALVGAELVGASSGLGYVISRAQSNLSTDLVIAGMAVIAVIGVIVDAALRRLTSRALAWSTPRSENS